MSEFDDYDYQTDTNWYLHHILKLLRQIVKQKHSTTRSVGMSLSLPSGQSVTETATAYQADGVTPDPNGVISWSDANNSGAGTITDNGTIAGVSTATVLNPTTGAGGVISLLASNADPDGVVVATGPNNPSTITCAAGSVTPPDTDATTVAIVDGTPA